MKGKPLFYVAIYGVVAYGGYYFFFSKTAYAKKIIAGGMYSKTLNDLKGFDYGYLRAWSISTTKNEPTFTYKGKVYVTKGGLAQK
jgi:hypothetical protein